MTPQEIAALQNSVQEKMAEAVDAYFDYVSHSQDIHPYSQEKEKELYNNMCWRWQDWSDIKCGVIDRLNFNDYTI